MIGIDIIEETQKAENPELIFKGQTTRLVVCMTAAILITLAIFGA